MIGVNVKRMAADFSKLEKEFSQSFHKITLEESEDDFYTEELACKVEKREPCDDGWSRANSATLELLVTAKDLSNADKRAKDPVYAVAPAHVVLDQEMLKDYKADYGEFMDEYRKKVEACSTSTCFSICTQTHDELKFDLQQPPLICYRHHYPTSKKAEHDDLSDQQEVQENSLTRCPTEECIQHDGECPHIYMNDVALIEVKPDQAKEILTCIKTTEVPRFVVNQLKRIQSEEQLNKLCAKKRPIAIQNATGHLIKLPKRVFQASHSSETQKKYAAHLMFILTSKDSNGTDQ